MDTYVALDLETTGLNPKKDKIIEIGAVRVETGEITETYTTFVKPGRRLEERVTGITGITEEMLTNAKEPEKAIPELLAFIGEDILVGHKILFDYSFVKQAAVNQKRVFEKEGIDTLMLARKFLPELPSKRLTDICAYYSIPLSAHRALADATATAMLYQKLAEQFYEAGSFRPYPLIHRVKKEGPITRVQKENIRQLIQRYDISCEYDVERMTKNEASRYLDYVFSTYGR